MNRVKALGGRLDGEFFTAYIPDGYKLLNSHLGPVLVPDDCQSLWDVRQNYLTESISRGLIPRVASPEETYQ